LNTCAGRPIRPDDGSEERAYKAIDDGLASERTFMSAQSHLEPGHREPAAGPSRRSMLRGAGAVGAVGIAAAVGVGTVGGVASAATRPTAERPTADHAAASTAGTPVVVYLRDAAKGELEVFSGTSRTVLVDRELAARLSRAAR
jgi:hypothetical protein